ncbi:glycosyltransferase family 20-domain-containing protein [Mycena amicta]|nr:glycosyltransferase family 20-domain-containing protein [Mycena amicta]
MNFDEENWLVYRQANLLFAEAALKQITPGAMVRVQDYHLMLMPMLLREGVETDDRATKPSKNIPGVKIGFFLHTPFPSSEIYRCFNILPVRREILLGILYCDLTGFHTYDCARRFLLSCTRTLALPTMPNGVEFEGRLAHVGTFPIGIEPNSFCLIRGISNGSVMTQIRQLESRFSGIKAIVGMTLPPANCTLVSAHIDELHVAASVGFKTAKVDQGVLFRSSQIIRTSTPA